MNLRLRENNHFRRAVAFGNAVGLFEKRWLKDPFSEITAILWIGSK